MSKEFRIDHDKISDPQKISQVNEAEFKERGMDLHIHEVQSLEDDHKRRQRILKVKNTKYFGPWSHRG